MPPTHFSSAPSVPTSHSTSVTKRTYCLSIAWKKSLALGGLFSSPAAPVWSAQGSLTRCLHGGCQLPVLLCCHVLAVGSFQGDAFVAPLDVEVAARVPVGQRGQSAGCDREGPCHCHPAGLERSRLDQESPIRSVVAG